MRPLLARSISLDSTLNQLVFDIYIHDTGNEIVTGVVDTGNHLVFDTGNWLR
jgi:hypothetical protein